MHLSIYSISIMHVKLCCTHETSGYDWLAVVTMPVCYPCAQQQASTKCKLSNKHDQRKTCDGSGRVFASILRLSCPEGQGGLVHFFFFSSSLSLSGFWFGPPSLFLSLVSHRPVSSLLRLMNSPMRPFQCYTRIIADVQLGLT